MSPVEGMALAVEQVLGQQAHEGDSLVALVLGHSLPGSQAGQLQPHCCAAQTALQQPGMPLLHLHHHTCTADNDTWHEQASKDPSAHQCTCAPCPCLGCDQMPISATCSTAPGGVIWWSHTACARLRV